MAEVTLAQVNENIIVLREEIEEVKELLEESMLRISDEAVVQVEESRKRAVSEFKSQEEIEKKFL